MKRVVFFKLLLILTIAIIPLDNIKSNNYEPCVPDCGADLWEPSMNNQAKIIHVEICGVNLELRYRYRIACNGYYDYYFEGIGSPNGNNDVAQAKSCYPDMASFIQACVEKLLIINPEGWPPQVPGTCNYMFRVIKGSCWFDDYIVSVGNGYNIEGINYNTTASAYYPYGWEYASFASPCPDIECCLDYYKVCVNSEGNKYIEQTGYTPPENQSCQPYPRGCEPACNPRN